MSWGKRIRIVFDRKVYNVTSSLKDYFRLIETTYETYIYPLNVAYGANDHEIYLEFDDFYRAVQPLMLEYLGGTSFGGKDFVMDPFTISPTILNCNPSEENEYLVVSDISVFGEIKEAFDGKLYGDVGYLQVGSISVAGTSILLAFNQRYAETGYLAVNSISVSGQYCDINSIPL